MRQNARHTVLPALLSLNPQSHFYGLLLSIPSPTSKHQLWDPQWWALTKPKGQYCKAASNKAAPLPFQQTIFPFQQTTSDPYAASSCQQAVITSSSCAPEAIPSTAKSQQNVLNPALQYTSAFKSPFWSLSESWDTKNCWGIIFNRKIPVQNLK